jgi:thioredoxin 1
MRHFTTLALLALLAFTGCTGSAVNPPSSKSAAKPDAKYVTLTVANFEKEVLQSSQPVLVDFWATWCGPCMAIGPTIEELAAEYEGKAKVGKINVDEQEALAVKYGAESIPLLLVFKDGKVVDKKLGSGPKAEIEALIKKAL